MKKGAIFKTIRAYIEAFGTVEPREALKRVVEVRGQIVDISAMLSKRKTTPPSFTIRYAI